VAEEFEDRFIRPIIHASYPGTLAALDLTVLQLSGIGGVAIPLSLRTTLLVVAAAFLLSAFTIFSHSLYPTRRSLWTLSALGFLVGLICSLASVFLLFALPLLP